MIHPRPRWIPPKTYRPRRLWYPQTSSRIQLIPLSPKNPPSSLRSLSRFLSLILIQIRTLNRIQIPSCLILSSLPRLELHQLPKQGDTNTSALVLSFLRRLSFLIPTRTTQVRPALSSSDLDRIIEIHPRKTLELRTG